MANQYIDVHRKIAARAGVSWRPILPVAAAALCVPWVSSTLMSFVPLQPMQVDGALWYPALVSLVTRMANIVAAIVILNTYSDLVRGSDRPVLDVHPVRATQLVHAIALRTFITRAYLPAVAAVLLSPLALRGHPEAYIGSLALVLAAWLAGLGVGFMVHLGGIWAASSEALSAVLDAIRGDNPRMQAALIYSPGAALLLVGVGVELGAIGLELGLSGWRPGWLWLAIPAAMGAAAFVLVGPLAERYYVRASLVLAEVDGAWGQAEQAEQAEKVYLEGLSRGDGEVLRALRLGWRTLRIYATGGWILGLLVAVAGWSAPERLIFWGGLAVVWACSVASLMPAHDPPQLDRALGVRAGRVMAARVRVAMAYGAGALVPVMAVVLVRHFDGGTVLGMLVLYALSGALSATAARMWRAHAPWAYGAVGIVMWSAFVGWVG